MQLNAETITTALKTLFEPGDRPGRSEIFEIRVLDAVLPNSNWQHVESGYFDYDHIDVVPNALANFKSYAGVYVTMNPVNPDLLARAANRLKTAKRGDTTSDGDILRRRWMLIDVDPVRPAGISATDSEKTAAFDLAMQCTDGLASMDWPKPMIVDSGNGTQLLYRIDMPTDDGGLIQRCLQALQPASNDSAHVDISVHNPARICRLPGTWNRKGDHIETRPHRLAEILEIPEKISVVSEELLNALSSDRSQDANSQKNVGGNDSDNSDFSNQTSNIVADDYNQQADIGPLLEKHGWKLKSGPVVPDQQNQQYWWRPGKNDDSPSATYNGEVFYPFSDNATPFEQNKGYSRFGVYAALEHGGDFSDATSALLDMGYGPQIDEMAISGIVGMQVTPSDSPSQIAQLSTDDGQPEGLRFTRADQIEIRPPDWLIRGMIERDSTALIFGEPGCGKSFVAIDWSCRITTGTPWRGHAVEPGPVAYILGEGQQGFGRRIRAWQEYNGISIDGAPLYMARAVAVPDPADLDFLIKGIYSQVGNPSLVVFDTLARNFGGRDENSTQDMSCFVSACDSIREKYGCTVLIVHHTGHGDKNRARGAIALKAALDAEYRLTKNDRLQLTATKMKEAELPDPLAMDLIKIVLPGIVDEEGKPVTSAAIEVIDANVSAIVAQEQDVPVDEFVKHCIEPFDPCGKSFIQNRAKQVYGLSTRKADELLDAAQNQNQVCQIHIANGSKYVVSRPGMTGDKALLVAALIAHDVEANSQDIADEVGVTRQYVNQIRRSLFGNWVETDGN